MKFREYQPWCLVSQLVALTGVVDRYGTGTLTSVFLDRVFQECLTYDGEMDYKTYLDFVLALENRKEMQSLQYMFRLLDVQNKGYLNIFDLNYFFRVNVTCYVCLQTLRAVWCASSFLYMDAINGLSMIFSFICCGFCNLHVLVVCSFCLLLFIIFLVLSVSAKWLVENAKCFALVKRLLLNIMFSAMLQPWILW